jgi:hypothetical protein
MAFVREMTEPLHAKTKATASEVKKAIKQYEIQRSILEAWTDMWQNRVTSVIWKRSG